MLPRRAAARSSPGRSLYVTALLWLAAGPAPALEPSRTLSQVVHRRFTDREGLPANSVRALLASRRGDLWIGTDEGVARFDGLRFTVFDRRSAPALGSNLVYALSEDPSGAIWVGTLDAGLYRLDAGRLSPAPLPAPLPSPQIRTLLDDGKGTLWIGTRKGLARLSGGTLATYGAAEGLPHPDVRGLALDGTGRLWVGTGRGAVVLEGGRLLPGPAALAGVAVTAIVEGAEPDERWFATDGRGVARQAGGTLSFLGPADGVPLQISFLARDRSGSIWLGGDEGILRLRGGKVERFDPRDGTDPLRAWAAAEDREGNLWTGSEGGGLELLRDGDFVTLGAAEGLPHDFTTAVLQDRGGDLWIGTYGGLAVAPGGDPARLRTVLRGRRPVISLADDGRGTIWVGFVDGGLARVRDGAVEAVVPPSPGRAVSALAIAPDGGVLAGTFLGLFRLEGKALVPASDGGLPAGIRVNALAWAPDGALWAGLEFQGAFRRPAGGRFERVEGGPPPGRDVNDFLVDADGAVWMGTLGAGLWRWQAGRGAGVTTQAGLFNDVVWRILDDGLGHLWLSSNKGLFRVDRAEVEAVLGGRASALASSAFGTDDGMRSRECNGGFQPAGWRAADGRLWIPTVKGVAFADPSRLKPVLAPPAVIDRAVVDGVERPGPAALALAPGTSRVVIGYSALAFSRPERVHFRYRLAGYDRDWIDAAEERTATYTNLPAGRYQLLVQARVSHGSWGEQAGLSIEQRPRLAERPWFWPLGGALLLAVAGLAFAARVRRLRAREAELQVRVQRALADIRQLEGLLPLCAWCKKVRDDAGYWKGIEVYLRDHGVADVSHGMCPDCVARHFPGAADPGGPPRT